MISVYLLQHSYENESTEVTKIIGIYSSRERAELILEKYKALPGFKEYPESFNIDEYEIDKDNWVEGFIKWED
jgi:homoserine kinase type II